MLPLKFVFPSVASSQSFPFCLISRENKFQTLAVRFATDSRFCFLIRRNYDHGRLSHR
jgi:hypothetical protein